MSRIDETNWRVEKMLKMEDPLSKTSAQIAKMLKPYDAISKQMQDMNKLMQPINEYIEMTKKMTPDYWAKLDNAFEASIKAQKAFNSLNHDAMLSTMSNIAKSLQTVEMQNTLKQLSKFESEFGAITSKFDWSKVEFKGNAVISYDGVDYNSEIIETELEEQTKILEDSSKSNEDRVKAWANLKPLINMILLVVSICTDTPYAPEILEFLYNKFVQLKNMITGKCRIGYTIREQSYLRKEANGKAEIIEYLPYDTCVEIIEEIPRWYQVRYISEENEEVIGWLSKISIEK